MGFIDTIKEKAKQNVKTIVLPETEAKRTYEAAEAVLRDGTAKLIYARARQMGYAVQEVKKGTQTQLVLVRCE